MKTGNKKSVNGSTIKVKLSAEANTLVNLCLRLYLADLIKPVAEVRALAAHNHFDASKVAGKIHRAGVRDGKKILQTWLSGIPLNLRNAARGEMSVMLFNYRYQVA